MYRFTSHITNGKLVLVRKKVGEGTCALVIMRAPSRNYCAPKPPLKEPTKSSNKLLWGTVGTVVLTGAAVVYAKSNPEARNWLSRNAPWADDFIALVYQENTTYWKTLSSSVSTASTKIADFAFGKEGVSPPDNASRITQDLDKDGAKAFAKKEYELPPRAFEPLYVDEKPIPKAEIDTKATLIQTEKCEPQQPEPIVITKDLVELEHDMHENVKIAIDNYKKATKHCADYNSALYRMVESSIEDLDSKILSALSSARSDKDTAIRKASEAAVKAKLAIDTLDRLLKAGVKAPPEVITSTNRYLKQFRHDLETVEKDYKLTVEKSVISDKYWNKVEAARTMFKDELQMLFPGVDLTSRKLNAKGDIDLLLIYTLKQIQFLQNEIAELQTVREQKLSRAIECHDEKDLIAAKVEDIVKKETVEKEKEYQKKSLIVQAEAERALREQLKKQMDIHQELLRDRLDKKEKEVLARFSKQVSEQVEAERNQYKQEVAALMGKLAAIENTLKLRAKTEAEAKRSQSLWTAAEALLAATKQGCSETAIDKEVQAIEKVGKDDKLVQTVMKGIPDNIRNSKITTEQSLRLQYDNMEKTALKVALVGKDGASLPVYFLSWLQSKLLFTKISEIPKDELEDKPVDFASLDTFEIMQRARYYIERGNIPSALRYVNLLQGASRSAALRWAENARAFLEVRQAAEAVMAHASASALNLKK